MVRIGDVSDLLMDEAVVTMMRITDMLHWDMGMFDMMGNVRGLNMVTLRVVSLRMVSLMSLCFVVLLLSSMLFLLSKHQMMNWLIMVYSNLL